MNNKFVQAYRQTPWRSQVQWIGLFLLALLLVAGVAGFYLSITSKSSTIGRQIQYLNSKIGLDKQDIENMNIELADLTSSTEMDKRAAALGFQPIDPQNETYVAVPGYTDPSTPQLGSQPGSVATTSSLDQPAYTESLWDWLVKFITSSKNGK